MMRPTINYDFEQYKHLSIDDQILIRALYCIGTDVLKAAEHIDAGHFGTKLAELMQERINGILEGE
jgi:hypothetical protein